MNASTEIALGVVGVLAIGAGLYVQERHQEREKEARDVAANQAKQMEELREGDVAMMRERGFEAAGGMIIHRARPVMLPFQQAATAARDLITRLQGILNRMRQQMFEGGEWHIGFVVIMAVLSLGWLFLFYLMRNLDISVMRAVGYSAGLSNLLGSVIALTISFLGIVVSGFLGMHTFLPKIDAMRRSLRVTIAMLLVVPVIALVVVVSTLAPYRSQATLGPQVSNYQKTLQEFENTTPRDPVEIAVTQDDLKAAQQRLNKGKTMDRTLAVTIPLGELLLSPTAVYGAELLVALELMRRISAARHREQAANDRVQAQTQNVLTYLVDVATAAGYTPGDVEGLMLPPETLDLPPAGNEQEPPVSQDPSGGEPGDEPLTTDQGGVPASSPNVGQPGINPDPPGPTGEQRPTFRPPDPFDLT